MILHVNIQYTYISTFTKLLNINAWYRIKKEETVTNLATLLSIGLNNVGSHAQ